MRRYLFSSPFWFALTLICSVCASGVTIFLAFLLQDIVDCSISGDLQALWRSVGTALAFLILDGFCLYARKISCARYTRCSMLALKQDAFQSLTNMDMEAFEADNSGDYFSLFNNDLKMIEENYILAVPEILEQSVLFVFAVAALFFLQPLLAVITIAINFLPILVPAVFRKRLADAQASSSQALSRYNVQLKDVLSGFEIIKSFRLEEKIQAQQQRYNALAEKCALKLRRLSALAAVFSEISSNLVFIVILIISAWLVIQGHFTMGSMIACVQLLNYVVNPVAVLSQKLAAYHTSSKIRSRVLRLLAVPAGSSESKTLPVLPAFRSFSLSHLTFAYPDQDAALKNLCFRFEAGKKYAIVGPSGCGKSTLLKLLMKYYLPSDGELMYNDTHISEIRRAQLYQTVTMLQQNIFLFDDTLRQNVALYGDYQDEELLSVLRQSGLSDKLSSLPMGLDTPLGENAHTFSGGERQRVAIARALLRRTGVLLMDEATSALDASTASQIESTILDDPDLTAIIVTHRLSEPILRRYDCIIMMKNGQITEYGDFETLIRQKGDFCSLFQMAS